MKMIMSTSSSSCLLMVLFCLMMSLLISTSTTLLGGGGGSDGGGVAQDVVLVCGAEGGGAPCPDGHCCSKWGHCAVNISTYCNLENCQSQCNHDDTLISTTTTTGDALQYSVPANRCGRSFEGALCFDDRCCSQHGWCGESYGYCGGGCQSNCYDPVKYQCGWHAGSGVVKCRGNRCCSKWGFCGDTSPYCCAGCQSNCKKGVCTSLNGGDHNGTLTELPLLETA